MHTTKLAALTFVPALLALAGCLGADANDATPGKGGGNNTTTSATNGNTQLCDDFCGKLNTCDNTNDSDTCGNLCKNSLASTLPKLREEIVSSISQCLQEKDCNTVLNKDPIATCAAEAVASAAPSADATAFCDALYKARTKCGDTSNKAACLSNSKLF